VGHEFADQSAKITKLS